MPQKMYDAVVQLLLECHNFHQMQVVPLQAVIARIFAPVPPMVIFCLAT